MLARICVRAGRLYVSNVYSIFGLCLSNGNCQASGHHAPLEARTEIARTYIDMVAQRGVRLGGNSLYPRVHPVKSVKFVRGGIASTTLPSDDGPGIDAGLLGSILAGSLNTHRRGSTGHWRYSSVPIYCQFPPSDPSATPLVRKTELGM